MTEKIDSLNISANLSEMMNSFVDNSNKKPFNLEDFMVKNLNIEQKMSLKTSENLNDFDFLQFQQFHPSHPDAIFFSGIKEFDINLDENDIEMLNKIANADSVSINKETQSVAIEKDGQTISYKSPDISKTLFNLLDYGAEVKRPVRLNINKNSSVILQVDSEGRVSAEFFSSDKLMEMSMKMGINDLRNKFEEQNLPYKHLGYKEKNNNRGKGKKKQ